jgi:hypothetical protein
MIKSNINSKDFNDINNILFNIHSKSLKLKNKNIITKNDKEYIDNKMSNLLYDYFELIKLEKELVLMELLYSKNKSYLSLNNIKKLNNELIKKQKQLGGNLNKINNSINKLDIQ